MIPVIKVYDYNCGKWFRLAVDDLLFLYSGRLCVLRAIAYYIPIKSYKYVQINRNRVDVEKFIKRDFRLYKSFFLMVRYDEF